MVNYFFITNKSSLFQSYQVINLIRKRVRAFEGRFLCFGAVFIMCFL